MTNPRIYNIFHKKAHTKQIVLITRSIGLVGRVFASGPGDLGSISGSVIPRLLEWYLIPHCLTLSLIRCVSRVKWSNPGKEVAPSPTPQCSSYWKRSLLIALDYGRQLYLNRLIGLVGIVFAISPEDLDSIPGSVIPKTFKMVLDTPLLNTQPYKVRIKGKVGQSRERSSALPYTSV